MLANSTWLSLVREDSVPVPSVCFSRLMIYMGVLILFEKKNEGVPQYLPFEPHITAATEYPITKYQPKYFVTESFAEAKAKVRAFARTLERPFSVRYNPFTENIDILDNKESLLLFGTGIHNDLKLFLDAMDKVIR